MNGIEEQALREENKRLKKELDLLRKEVKQLAEQETHQMMRAIFHELPSAILIKDIEDDYRFYIINRKFEQMCNISQESLVGKTDYEIFPKEEADKYRKDDVEASAYTEEAPMLIHEIVTSPDRSVSTHLQTVKFSFSFKGKRLLVCVGNDVTLQHQMMEKLQDALNKAEQADRLKSRFIANMSHEIRTPLNSIVGFSQLIVEAENKEQQEEYSRIVAFNNNLLLALIDDVLNLSMLDSGCMSFKETLFDFPKMFGELAVLMNAKVSNPNVEFICENQFEELTVKTERDRIVQIITHLVANAAKFTQHGYIKMGYTCKNGGLEIYVEDTGIGIDAKQQTEIFDRFKKVNPFAQGTGLGLSICKSITEQMNGRIWVESELGKGSVFYVWIPCLQV
ncbi:PAS domain-containing sensor histidine kinase [Bacteroides rodentium]|uniref:PAS domain-containing sensor histidine kinase n=1 Tax=Bacteroides rodentium TaxID=691816 RepID=UPI000471AC17|nr:PAS domain-containing sensor histidine kinase [Bacteroides rodentium]